MRVPEGLVSDTAYLVSDAVYFAHASVVLPASALSALVASTSNFRSTRPGCGTRSWIIPSFVSEMHPNDGCQ
jgi:hypothetical protein